MAVALIPTVLFHLAWFPILTPPSDLLLYIFTVLLCVPLDYTSIKIIWKPSKWAEEMVYWRFCYFFQFGYILVVGDILLYRWMDGLGVSRKVKIPVVFLLIVLSFFTFIAGIIGESRGEQREKDRFEKERRRRPSFASELTLVASLFSSLLV